MLVNFLGTTPVDRLAHACLYRVRFFLLFPLDWPSAIYGVVEIVWGRKGGKRGRQFYIFLQLKKKKQKKRGHGGWFEGLLPRRARRDRSVVLARCTVLRSS